MRTQGTDKGTHGIEFPPGRASRFSATQKGIGTLLLLSTDERYHEELRGLANTWGLLVVRVAQTAGLAFVLRATKPIAVLLDLDQPDRVVSESAQLLFDEPAGPPVILLTSRTAQFQLGTVIRAGSLVGRREPPSLLLKAVEEALEVTETFQAERNAIQRLLIGWLGPSHWENSASPIHRFWGINE